MKISSSNTANLNNIQGLREILMIKNLKKKPQENRAYAYFGSSITKFIGNQANFYTLNPQLIDYKDRAKFSLSIRWHKEMTRISV